ncbi:uncharacterized protein LOC132736361 [Ruditapes philippinarum]|uniref:uncharacterized protein LOC132736361 n=1 Tax=Ruditapes philippinarum TaxID=129788 RepID=UPI00295B034E|nr:uncharacterized protein LOC132736361 [Ruditapes philippinarum]
MGLHEKDPEPDFNDCLMKVFRQKLQRKRQEHACKTANQLIKQVTDIAFSLSTEWKEYTTCSVKSGGVRTTPLRTLGEGSYECMVPLKRPMRLDGFKVFQRGIDEMPLHRCLIQVNPALCKQEQHLVNREWEPFIDNDGFLRPTGILNWFNRGLHKACQVLLTENHNVDKLGCYVGDDGTATIHATMSDFDGDELQINVFNVNIYPVFALDRLPSSVKLSAPLPCYGDYIQGQKEFRNLVLKDLEDGKPIAFLDPKSDVGHSLVKKCLPKDGPTWKINISLTEYHVYSLIDKYCRGLKFRHVLILMSILREEHPKKLGPLNNEILVNTLFNVSQRYIDKIRDKKVWIFQVIQTLIDYLEQGFLPSFYLPRQDLLHTYGISKEKQNIACETLKAFLSEIKSSSKKLMKHTGYVDPFKMSLQEAMKMRTDTRDGRDDSENVPNTQGEDGVPKTNEDRKMSSKGQEKDFTDDGPVEDTDRIGELPRSAGFRNWDNNFEDESGISKPSKGGERSDIF